MKLKQIVNKAANKNNFTSIQGYVDFSRLYLEYIKNNLQAVIVSKNENIYRFFQYKKEGTFNVTRPINSEIMLSLENFEKSIKPFFGLLESVRNKSTNTEESRHLINNFIYTCQQSIGATLDALPANRSNTARKINGDLFERFIRLVIEKIGIKVCHGTIAVPVKIDGEVAFHMNYQHDLIIKVDDDVTAIGSVKTSSKDRLDKIFIDKFLFNQLTDKKTPHFAVFLNDVQRKGAVGKYGINATFLPGHFKGYTIKLNPLDGVYYFDIRPNMRTESILKDHIKTFDHLIMEDIWKFVV
ncbi:MAG: hypothetical protein UW91_C0022G0007 [Parcubacteria group bacterium GW2011_GWF2_45_11]|nr:MAG: hypothetical protein UW91_C0022G0007 [Parcubacteria group bacterium GW2011_GWF2_45_11]